MTPSTTGIPRGDTAAEDIAVNLGSRGIVVTYLHKRASAIKVTNVGIATDS
jgi:hypothetical protein